MAHPSRGSGGRRATVRGGIAGLADSDRDVVEFPRRAGPPEDERPPAAPARGERAGGRAHVHDAA